MEKPESGAQLQYELELLVYIPFRGSGSSGKLSKYVFVLSFEKYAPKLQKIIETESYKVKKVTKRDNISPFEDQNDIKMAKSTTESYNSNNSLLPLLPVI